ncbi:MAG: IPT/TIG domain-containing protein, partial [Proteobacteria bacterium]|nr:IPT/TIG domain-containing protein [Pseudomonadota bacterium]
EVVELDENLVTTCPAQSVLDRQISTGVDFLEALPTEYVLEATDTVGQVTRRSFIVTPLTNLVPAIRITAPADGQPIVAGTFRVKLGVVAADDRPLNENDIQVFANGIRLNRIGQNVLRGDDEIGGTAVIEQAFDEIVDEFEAVTSAERAREFGQRTSPNALETGFVFEVPEGLVRFDEDVEITALVRDSEGATGRHVIDIVGAADEIRPEVAINAPAPGFGPPEGSTFTAAYRAFDNVKVEQIELFTTVSVLFPDGSSVRRDYGTPLASNRDIEARDFLPITTVNIDTPEFQRLITAPRLSEFDTLFPNLTITGDELYFLWLRVVASDRNGNERVREISVPIRVDEPPRVDILAPVNGAQVVEETRVVVNVSAFDDVGIDSLRMRALRGLDGDEFDSLELRQPPYTFAVTLPPFNSDVATENDIRIEIEAIDTFGAETGELTNHRALESVNVTVVEDQPPVVAIGNPENDSTVIEGELLLVQVNAVDDVGIDRVVLNAQGLVGGDVSRTDVEFPFEFVLPIDYGQAGQDVTLTAIATESRLAGEARSVTTLTPTVVHVAQDVEPPEIILNRPLVSGTTVAEKRDVVFDADIRDNVRVTNVNVAVLADLDADGTFEDTEVVTERVLFGAPYQGQLPVGSFQELLGPDSTASELELEFRMVAKDGAGNTSEERRPVTLVRNAPPTVADIQILDNRGFLLGAGIAEVTEGRNVLVNVVATDPEVGVASVRLFRADNPTDTTVFQLVREDVAAPFQFAVQVPLGRVGDVIAFRAIATDIDGFESPLSDPRSFTVAADQPPTAQIIQPANNETVLIEGEDLEVLVEAIDDLGAEGIDRVVFYVNDRPVFTATGNVTEITGAFAQEQVYRALIAPPEGLAGFTVQAEAFDVAGNSTRSQVVRVGQIADTVAPELEILSPIDGDILTAGEELRLVAAVSDIGDSNERIVSMTFSRQRQSEATNGEWVEVASETRPLLLNDDREPDPLTPLSDPDNFRFIYFNSFVGDSTLVRETDENERVVVTAVVDTPNHLVERQTFHEVGLLVSKRRYLRPDADTEPEVAKEPYYSAVAQFRSPDRQGALVAAWSSLDPMRFEPGLGNLLQDDFGPNDKSKTGLFLAFEGNDIPTDGSGDRFIFDELLASSAEVYAGVIGELHADADFVLASKTGSLPGVGQFAASGFASALEAKIQEEPDTGNLFLDNDGGELLIFTVKSAPGGLSLPYTLEGRVDMPFPTVLGLTRQDDLAFVANGNGGVQVLDISNLSAPYRVGFVKPNGFARDVEVKGEYLYIAASSEGLVVADITDPSLPIVATLDTLGVANRIAIAGNRAFVTDMAGPGGVSQLNIIDITNPLVPVLERSVELVPARPDLVADGAYDVTVAGNVAYVTVHYSDQEDQPAQSIVEIVNLEQLEEPARDATLPAVIHRVATPENFAGRGMVFARDGFQVAAGKSGVNEIDLATLAVVDHQPGIDATDVPTDLPAIEIELSAVLSDDFPDDLGSTPLIRDFIQVFEGDPLVGEDVTARFAFQFRDREGAPARRFVALVPAGPDAFALDTQYFVVVRAGLASLAGITLPADYRFAFTTSAAGTARPPDIISIAPAIGGIEGGTLVEVCGAEFGLAPRLLIGKQELVVLEVRPPADPDAPGACTTVVAETVPNNAGPAAVEIVNDAGLRDRVVGGFTYVDVLELSFIDPPVVESRQDGANARVDVVGFGFHDGVRLFARKTGDPSDVREFTVDQDRLRLESAQRMFWVVPDFEDASGQPYRGFVDVEIEDDNGRRFVLPRGLFYGRGGLDRELVTELPLTKEEVQSLLSDGAVFVPDPLKLPPGDVVDIEIDSDLNVVYVLGAGSGDPPLVQPRTVVDPQEFENFTAPGWISLVRYEEGAPENAAPLHGLGYANLPQDLLATTLHLTDEKLYVAAGGFTYPFLDTPFEGRTWLLVYDRVDSLPGDTGGEPPPGQDRSVLYALPLPFAEAPTRLVHEGDLLFAASPADGVAVIHIGDPEKPVLVQVLDEALAGGRSLPIQPTGLDVRPGQLHVRGAAGLFVFDTGKPGLPQLSFSEPRELGVRRGLRNGDGGQQGSTFATHAGDSPVRVAIELEPELLLTDTSRPEYLRPLGEVEDFGVSLGVIPTGVASGRTLAASVRKERCQIGTTKGERHFVSLYEIDRPELINLVDGFRYFPCTAGAFTSRLAFSDDGLLALANVQTKIANYAQGELRPASFVAGNRFSLFDTLLLDLVRSNPAPGAVGVPVGAPLVLEFNREVPPAAELASYLSLRLEDGSPEGEDVLGTIARACRFTDEAETREVCDVVVFTPSEELDPIQSYRLELQGVIGSRRTEGLVFETIPFTTARDDAPPVEIVRVESPLVETTGGVVAVVLRNADAPAFLVAGEAADAELAADQTGLEPGESRYQLLLPDNLEGAADLLVLNGNESRARLAGAVVYLERVEVLGLAPGQGSVNGGTRVRITGKGFRPGLTRTQVFFDEVPVPEADVQVLDSETLEVVTPAGRLGFADVRVALDTGQERVLEAAFEYQQPVQSSIPGERTEIHDLELDPTGTFAIAAAGGRGVVIYNVDPSTFTTPNDGDDPDDAQDLLNPDDLRGLVDLDGDERDDRIVAQVPLPGGYQALGVSSYFERNTDRVFVTGVRNGQASLFILAFDSADIESTTMVRALPLPTSFARGIEAENGHAVIAMGEAGLGVVDVFLQTQSYLVDAVALPEAQAALDVERLPVVPGVGSRYAVVSGEFDVEENALRNALEPGSGGFYLYEQRATEGFVLLGSLPVPASRVVVEGTTAYLASGDGGLVVVDIQDPTAPEILARVNELGPVYDVDVNGNTAYVAVGAGGIVTLDVTDPARPLRFSGAEAFAGADVRVVLGTAFSAIGGGRSNRGSSVLQVTPDVILKVHRVDPPSGILDRDAAGNLLIRVRFNKSIEDAEPLNAGFFDVRAEDGRQVAFSVDIINNDALLVLDDAEPFTVGERITVTVGAGIEVRRPLSDTAFIRLFTLGQDQVFEFRYRGTRPDTLSLDSVVPRRVRRDEPAALTISGLGIPADPARVRAFVGGTEAVVTSVQSSDVDERAAIVFADLPALPEAGQYDVSLALEKDGLVQTVTLRGGLVVDAPLVFASRTPAWGPRQGGTTVTLLGEGFEPGNTVIEGLEVTVGSLPVRSIEVLSTTEMRVVVRGGESGVRDIVGRNRYGDEAALMGDDGFGYGLRLLATQAAGAAAPSDITIDPVTGVAITSGGVYSDSGELALQLFQGALIPDSIRAATFDVNDPLRPLLVGAVPALESGPDGRQALAEFVTAGLLLGRTILDEPLTQEEEELLDRIQGGVLPFTLDSLRVVPVSEVEDDVERRRLYVANGTGGIARLNLDDQNGLQLLSEVLNDQPARGVIDLLKLGNTVFATRSDFPGQAGNAPCSTKPGEEQSLGRVVRVNYSDPLDPVFTGEVPDARGSLAIERRGDWVYSGGVNSGIGYNTGKPCNVYRPVSYRFPDDEDEGVLYATNVLDPVLTQQFPVEGNVRDVALFGDHVLVALGGAGLTIFDRNRPEERTRFTVEADLQPQGGDVSRIHLFGNLAFLASQQGGIVVLDLAEPLAPQVVSAGNTESVEALDVFRGRIVAARRTGGIGVFDLPQSVVTQSSRVEGEAIAAGEPFAVTFNEPITEVSITGTAVSVTRLDTGAAVPATVTPVDLAEGAARTYEIAFDREGGAEYRIAIDGIRNTRGGELWRPYSVRLRAAADVALQPVIREVEGGAYHRGVNEDIFIRGDGFRDSDELQVFVDQFAVEPGVYERIDAQTLRISTAALDMALPLDVGEHDIKVQDGELSALFPGALVIGEELDVATFTLSRDSATIEGGHRTSITASDDVILPGARVIFRPFGGGDDIRTEEIAPGVLLPDLEDDVVTLSEFRFRVPGVQTRGLYQVWLETGGREVFVGNFSYRLEGGRGIELPNYPPMVVGAAERRGDELFVGVKAGSNPTRDNRFLMRSGLEIYDVGIGDRPVRLSQLRTEAPVTGLAVVDDGADLAAGTQGLLEVDIDDTGAPVVVRTQSIPGHRVTDVAVDRERLVLAAAVADDLGTGFIRFFDLQSDDLGQPIGFPAVALATGEREGEPLDVQWLEEELYVLLERDGQLHLLIVSGFGGELVFRSQAIERGELVGGASFVVQHGQIAVSTDAEFLVLQQQG